MSYPDTTPGTTTTHLEDVQAGQEIPELVKGPMTTMHLMRWSAAIENWHRIHYDQRFATRHDGLPDVLVNGSWMQHVLAQMLKDFAGPDGWVRGIKFSYRSMVPCGSKVIAYGAVEDVRTEGDWGVVDCTVGIKTGTGEIATNGTGEVVLPRRYGPPPPYPDPYAVSDTRPGT